jgi:hypothetical protein
MFSGTKKASINTGEKFEVQDESAFDYSKITSSASQKRKEGDGEDQNNTHTIHRQGRDRGQAFDPEKPQDFIKHTDPEDDFTIVTSVKHAAPSQFYKSSGPTFKPMDNTKAPVRNNKFDKADW